MSIRTSRTRRGHEQRTRLAKGGSPSNRNWEHRAHLWRTCGPKQLSADLRHPGHAECGRTPPRDAVTDYVGKPRLKGFEIRDR